jgi:hygromycin-B 4-O-kinase
MAKGAGIIVHEDVVARILAMCVGQEPAQIATDSIEQICTSFECLVGNESFVVEFRKPNMAQGLRIERLLGKRLNVVGVPIREVIADGTHEGLMYTVARKERGRKAAELVPDEFGAALPSIFNTLLALSSVDVDGTEGYGWFDQQGVGTDRTWPAHLARIKDEEPGLFFGNWHSLFETTFLERERYDFYYSKMMNLTSGIDVPRLLVHGSFGPYKVLIENGIVSSVLDWADVRFGDPLFDLAYMDFWPTGYKIVDLFETHCTQLGINHKDFRKRVAVCKYYQALGAMMYFAKIDNQDAYQKVVRIGETIRP